MLARPSARPNAGYVASGKDDIGGENPHGIF